MRLSEALLSLLCPFSQQPPRAKRCECEDPQPYRTGCGYGECVILRCRRCSGVITYESGPCRYPYSL